MAKTQKPKLVHHIKHRTHRHGPMVLAAILLGGFIFSFNNVTTAAAMASDVITSGFSNFGASKSSSATKSCSSKQWQQGKSCVSKCSKGYLQKKSSSKKQCVKTCGSNYKKSGNKCAKKSSKDKSTDKKSTSSKGGSCKAPLKTNSKGVCYDPAKVCPVGYKWSNNHVCYDPKKHPSGPGNRQAVPAGVGPQV